MGSISSAPRWRTRRPESPGTSPRRHLHLTPEEIVRFVELAPASNFMIERVPGARRRRGAISAKEREALWRRANPDKVAAQQQRRRARLVGAEGTYTADEWNALCLLYENRCLCCGVDGRLTVDHVVPLSKGGANSIDNIQPLCGSCNKRKNTKTIDYRQK